MKYIDMRDRIQSGDVIALSHYAWGSFYDLQVQAVRVGTESEYSHVGLAWVIAGRVFVLESVVPFVRLVPLSAMAERGFYWMPMDVPMSEMELEFALSKVALGRYSKWQAILAQFRKLKIGVDDLWECAEFLIAARRLSGVDLGDKATPSAVVRAAQDRGSAVYFVSP